MIDKKRIFNEYYFKLVLEGALKSLVFGLIAGFAVSIIPALVGLIYNFNGILFSILFGFAALAITAPIIYFLLFKPDSKQIAARIDRLGLDERVITMLELESDESYIAMRQREDAKGKLSQTNSSRLKISVFSLPIFVFIILGVLFACSVSMITVSAMSVDEMKGWKKPGGWKPHDYEYVRVRFVVEDGGGFILGETDQLVPFGGETSAVIAISDIGYVFRGWTDGMTTQERIVINVGMEMDEGQEELVYSAAFIMEVEGDNSDMPNDKPAETPPDSDEQKEDENDMKEDDDSSKNANQVVDGNQYYRDPEYFEYMYQQAMDFLSKGGEISPEIRELIETYFDIIL